MVTMRQPSQSRLRSRSERRPRPARVPSKPLPVSSHPEVEEEIERNATLPEAASQADAPRKPIVSVDGHDVGDKAA